MKLNVSILLIAVVMATPARGQQCDPNFTNTIPCRDFGDLVCNMKAYDPNDFNPGATPDNRYSPPKCDDPSVNPVNPTHKTLLKEAYDLAPTSVQEKLCRLDQVFVTTASSHASREPLGIWEAPRRGGGTGTRAKVYIAIPDNTLNSASSLAEEEKEVFTRLLTDPRAPGRSLPYFQNGNALAQKPAAAILAVLAHELGHILLADGNLDRGGASDSGPKRRPCPAPGNNCFKDSFTNPRSGTTLWDRAHFHGNLRRWVAFGDTNRNTYLNPDVDFSAIKAQINDATKDADSTDRIRKIYGAGLVSVLAAVSPEEDFVETYKYKVLAAVNKSGAQLQLNVNIPSGTPIDVLKPLRPPSGDLAGKVSCVP